MIINYGNTPLHVCSARGHSDCVEALLLLEAPVLIRNSYGETARDVATGRATALLDSYLGDNTPKRYDIIQKHARKKYSRAEHVTRIFVIGNSGAGKSSLIEAMKRENFLESFSKVSESSVPPHTAGIVPTVHVSKHYGRLLFYDFAGYREYYSSHAAILENLVSCRKGDNIFIVVVDLTEDNIQNLYYWLSFIQHQKFEGEGPSLIIAGSHSDLVSKEVREAKCRDFKEFCENIHHRALRSVAYFLLDCRKPRSKDILYIQKEIMILTKESPCYKLSLPASILFGLLVKDFSNVMACSVQTVISHVEDTGIKLPQPSLHSALCELHEIGLLFMVSDSTKENVQVILNISELTNKVHQLLFQGNAHFSSYFNGIIPLDILHKILPKYITKECLVYLQYCQEITRKDIGVFPSLAQTNVSDQYFLYFPALCCKDKDDLLQAMPLPAANSYSIGWLAQCTDNYDYFPPRFLHVLLLRLVFRFTLSVPSRNQASGERRCTMWKTGVHWSMEEGVQCTVELLENKGVVVITKSIKEWEENCTIIFNRIVSCVMEAKAEFCHSIKLQFYLLTSTEPANYLNEDNLFEMSDVERVLTSLEGTKVQVLSVSGKGEMERSRLLYLRWFTHWSSIFPIDSTYVLHYLKDIVRDLVILGVQLDLPMGILEAIDMNLQVVNGERGRRELVKGWMNSQNLPCWWYLVQALKEIDYCVLAEEIQQKHSKSRIIY